ncbi:hypothetical protein QZH41_005337 [Actinostola sp. cb2023]|nr:hypothetical protein QZH41_005337 [Actinostola sp. cb2023]
MTLGDFGRQPERVRTEVNEWVRQQTHGKIKDFLPAGVLNLDTKLALINAIYFDGAWKYEFDRQRTFRAPFYAFGRRENEMAVEMMSMSTKLQYYFDEEHGCRILQLPYSGNKLSMILLLPEELDGLGKLEKSLSIDNLDKWALLMTNITVSVELPKFKLSQQFELNKVLPQLGMRDVFDASQADLSGISATTGLFVSNIIHKSHVEVNERGTEAAAATGVVMRKRSLDMNEIFHADHPFLFLIRHHSSGSILFVGRFQEPQNIGESNLTHDRLKSDELKKN